MTRGPAEQRRGLCEWFDTPLGRSLQAIEVNSLRDVMPNLFGTVSVQLGRIGQLDMMDACAAPTRIVLDLLPDGVTTTVRGAVEELPFDTKSVDLALLPHTLDFSRDPHHVLREVNRVLTPEGHAVILGFNPVSFWGLRRLFTRPRTPPWSGQFLRLARVKDWLALLDFEPTHGRMLYYRPPLRREAVMDRLHFLDKAGDRWWPLFAAVYLVVAKKRVAGVTPLPLKWKGKRLVDSAVGAAPARRMRIAAQSIRLRRCG